MNFKRDDTSVELLFKEKNILEIHAKRKILGLLRIYKCAGTPHSVNYNRWLRKKEKAI